MVSSDSDAEEDVQDILPSARRKVGGKKIHVNIIDAALDNVSFHSESSTKRWMFFIQRRIYYKRELSEEALGYKYFINPIKVA